MTGIAGLNEGLKFISSTGMEAIRAHEINLCRRMQAGLEQIAGVWFFVLPLQSITWR